MNVEFDFSLGNIYKSPEETGIDLLSVTYPRTTPYITSKGIATYNRHWRALLGFVVDRYSGIILFSILWFTLYFDFGR